MLSAKALVNLGMGSLAIIIVRRAEAPPRIATDGMSSNSIDLCLELSDCAQRARFPYF